MDLFKAITQRKLSVKVTHNPCEIVHEVSKHFEHAEYYSKHSDPKFKSITVKTPIFFNTAIYCEEWIIDTFSKVLTLF